MSISEVGRWAGGDEKRGRPGLEGSWPRLLEVRGGPPCSDWEGEVMSEVISEVCRAPPPRPLSRGARGGRERGGG